MFATLFMMSMECLGHVSHISLFGCLAAIFTVKRLAERWEVKQHSVLAHIHNGSLKAFNAARPEARKPYWRITPEAVEAFETGVSAAAAQGKPKRSRRKSAAVKDFF